MIEGRRWGCGTVIRGQLGEFHAGSAAGFLGDISVLEAEAHGLMLGLSLAADLGLTLLKVEIDSQSLVKLLNSTSSPLSYIGSLYGDLLSLLEDVGVVSLEFKPRESNGVAHRLVQWIFLYLRLVGGYTLPPILSKMY